MDENPYETPVADLVSEPQNSGPEPSWLKQIGNLAKPVFLRWEVMRAFFLVAVGFVVIGYSRELNLDLLSYDVLPDLILAAVAANIFFFAGPIVETYFAWLGFKTLGLRIALFIGGTGLTCYLAILTLQEIYSR